MIQHSSPQDMKTIVTGSSRK
ncbi:protein of unknown function [Burkholderia multivorans]